MSNFVDRMVGKGEIPIKEMPGFHSPSDKEHENIQKTIGKKIKRDFVITSIWTLISLAFTGMYALMYFRLAREQYFIIAGGIFACMTLVGLYRLVVTDRKIYKIINDRNYTLRTAKIHHLMPGINMTRAFAKVGDGDKVYSYEFQIGRRILREYKKDPEKTFVVVCINRDYICSV